MDNGKISIAVVTDRFFTSNHASVIRIRSIVNAINNTNKFDIKIYSTKQGYKKEIYPSSMTFSSSRVSVSMTGSYRVGFFL